MKDSKHVRFELNLDAPELTRAQAAEIGGTIRKAAADKLRHLKFEMEEIGPLHASEGPAEGCGGGCRA